MVLFVYTLSSCADLSILEDDIDIPYQTWCAPTKTVEVTRIIDGDTFVYTAEGEEMTVRTLGFDAPETEKPDAPAECYGNEATEFLASLVEGEEVRLEFDVECTDDFGRSLAWFILEGDDPEIAGMLEAYSIAGLNSESGSYEVLVNEVIVRMGYAKLFVGEVDKSVRYKTRMKDAEEAAELFSEGLWNDCE